MLLRLTKAGDGNDLIYININHILYILPDDAGCRVYISGDKEGFYVKHHAEWIMDQVAGFHTRTMNVDARVRNPNLNYGPG